MDYVKIYDNFILDRILKQTALLDSGDYCERHHIVPRSFGGSDSSENIVALTPEDHFFAHLLLARIHGGKMVFALQAMANLKNKSSRRPNFSMRLEYAHIRKMVARNYSENFSGINSPTADRGNYCFKNHDGQIVFGNRVQIERYTGLSKRAVSHMIHGYKKNYNGWYCADTHDGSCRAEIYRQCSGKVNREVLQLFHYNGERWVGTRAEFNDYFGKRLYFQTADGHCAGWYRSKHAAESHYERISQKAAIASRCRGNISGDRNPRADKKIYKWKNYQSGEIFFATRSALAEMIGLKRKGELSAIIGGRQKTIRGWGLCE